MRITTLSWKLLMLRYGPLCLQTIYSYALDESSKLRDILESHGNKYLEYRMIFPFFLVVNHGWSYKSHMWSFLVVDECKKPKIAFLGNRKEKGGNDSIFKAEIHSSKTNVVQEQNDWFMNLWFYCLKRTFLCSIQSIVKLYWLLCFLRNTTFWNANAPKNP